MNRRQFFASPAALAAIATSPSLAEDGVTWFEEVQDFGNGLGICGIVGSGKNQVRAAVLIPMVHRLSEDGLEQMRQKAKQRILFHLQQRTPFCRYADDVVSGNEELMEW